jgi:hypothetical protein
MIDFMNLKIKPAQSFRGGHRDNIYVRVFIGVSAHMCMSIVLLKKKLGNIRLKKRSTYLTTSCFSKISVPYLK